MGTPIDRDKLLSIGYLSGGRSKPQVKEYRDETDGHRVKVTTDEAGNDVIQHNTPDDRQDVLIRPKTIEMDIQVNS
jgi:hypothetical protein